MIAETCDRVLIMYAGRVAEEGTCRRVFRTPRHPYTQKLLSSFPNIRADRRTLEVIPGYPPDLAIRRPAAGSTRAARSRWMSARPWSRPMSRFADGVRVACHLYPHGSDGAPVTAPPQLVAAESVGVGAPAAPSGSGE